MSLKMGMNLHNKFDIVVTDIVTGETTEAKAENVVLNRLYPLMVADAHNPGIDSTYVGSGTNTPSVTDTTLQTQLLKRANNGSWNKSEFKVGGSGVMVYTGTMRIEATELVGASISEVGLGGNQGLITRALLQDANGNVITIRKTNTMVIDIYATAFLVIPTTISGYKVCGREIPFDLEAYRLLWFTGMDSNTCLMKRNGKSWNEIDIPASLVTCPTASLSMSADRDQANLKITYTLANVPVGSANIGGIRSILVGDWIEIPVPNDTINQPVLTKEVVGVGDGVKKGFSTKFGWIRNNGTLKVYVNDIEQTSGFTVRYDQPPSAQGHYYMESTGKTNSLGSPTYKNVSGAKVTKTKSSYRTGHYITASDSPDGVFTNVVEITASNTDYDIPPEFQSKLYWGANDSYSLTNNNETYFTLESDIRFDAAPANGSTVAVTYQPDCIAKDETRIINNISYALSI